MYDFEDWDGAILIGWVTNIFKFNYLEIPLLFKARWPGRFSPYTVIGPSIAVLLSATVENVYEDDFYQGVFNGTWDNPADLINYWKIDLNSLDIGLVAGGGLDILVGSILLNVEARYTLGVIPVSAALGFTNGVFSFSGGVGFQF
jgi:hypothetical protein